MGIPCRPIRQILAPLPCLSIRLGRTKTTTNDDDDQVFLIGRPVLALKGWLEQAGLRNGPVFRRIDQWGNIDRRALTLFWLTSRLRSIAQVSGYCTALPQASARCISDAISAFK